MILAKDWGEGFQRDAQSENQLGNLRISNGTQIKVKPRKEKSKKEKVGVLGKASGLRPANRSSSCWSPSQEVFPQVKNSKQRVQHGLKSELGRSE
jgi:hypothetical protein